MTHEVCILFAYHKVDKLTKYHFNLLKKSNPHHPVVPITDDVNQYLPETVDVKHYPDFWPKTNPWRRCDTMLYRWFLNRNVTAKRYILFEYDCRCTVDVVRAYADVWNADLAARDFFTPGELKDTRQGQYVPRQWHWFKEIPFFPAEDHEFVLGLAPLMGILMSHQGLEAIVNMVSRRDIFCELRLATAAKKANLKLSEFPESLKQTIWWDPHPKLIEKPGIYHSIKHQAYKKSGH